MKLRKFFRPRRRPRVRNIRNTGMAKKPGLPQRMNDAEDDINDLQSQIGAIAGSLGGIAGRLDQMEQDKQKGTIPLPNGYEHQIDPKTGEVIVVPVDEPLEPLEPVEGVDYGDE